jgi:hypothetical protein
MLWWGNLHIHDLSNNHLMGEIRVSLANMKKGRHPAVGFQFLVQEAEWRGLDWDHSPPCERCGRDGTARELHSKVCEDEIACAQAQLEEEADDVP